MAMLTQDIGKELTPTKRRVNSDTSVTISATKFGSLEKITTCAEQLPAASSEHPRYYRLGR